MIGIFDSGIGGLSIWKGIIQTIPRVSTVYVADQKWAPYGNRPISEIRDRGYAISRYLKNLGASVIVMACNTATVSVTVEDLRERLCDLNFVGVEPPIKKLAKTTKTNSIALFATKATCESERVKVLMSQFASEMQTQIIPTVEWANLVEDNFPEPETTESVNHYLAQIQPKTDVVGLGCTHYPFLKPWLQKSNNSIDYLDVVSPVARQVKRVYSEKPEMNPLHQFFTTGAVRFLKKPLKDLLGDDSPVESITI